MPKLIEHVYQKQFNKPPTIKVQAPGRVNLIGEHTDYNLGFVMPMAINMGVQIALTPSRSNRVSVYSVDFGESFEFDVSDFKKDETGWKEYIKGAAWVLRKQGLRISGWRGVISGDLPMRIGLSSSSALEIAVIKAFQSVSDFTLDDMITAKLGQKVEQNWIGLNCGIMDQLVCVAGKKNHALLIDCRSLEIEFIPLPVGCLIAVLDTSTRRELTNSEYNKRSSQCKAAANAFNVSTLRDVSYQMFTGMESNLDEIIRKRARHVITENQRTLDVAGAMKEGKSLEEIGRLLEQSHLSLRDDLEISDSTVDHMVKCAGQIKGCYGARMTGDGFGSCAVALIDKSFTEYFTAELHRRYHQATGLIAKVYITSAESGARIFEL